MANIKELMKAKQEASTMPGISSQLASINDIRSEEEQEALRQSQKEAGIKKEQNLLTVRIDADMYKSFSIYCEAMGTNMSKEIKQFIKNVILNNQGIINNNRK